MKVLILAGYETTSSTYFITDNYGEDADPILLLVSLTVRAIYEPPFLCHILTISFLQWALIELSKNPDYQSKLREEILSHFGNSDPTYDQLTMELPYLDAIVHETLRLHPPLPETTRVVSRYQCPNVFLT